MLMRNIAGVSVIGLLFPVIGHAQAVSIEQKPANQGDVSILSREAPADQPDESILWALFHNGNIAALRFQIGDLQKRYPDWQVPTDLLKALQSAKKPVQAKRPKSTLSRKRVQVKICSNLDAKWDQAANYADSQDYDQAIGLYKKLITACQGQGIKETTLNKAGSHLPYDEFMALVDFSAFYLSKESLDKIKYQWLKNDYLKYPPANLAEQKKAVASLTESLTYYQDSSLANAIAWRYFDLQDYGIANQWFDMAGNMNVAEQSISAGKLLALEKLGEYDQLLVLYSEIQAPDSGMKAIAARVYKLKAWQGIESGDFTNAQQNVLNAERIVGQDFETQEINAWIANADKQYAKAAKLFESLYQQSPRREYAQAFVQNQYEADPAELDSKLIQYGGRVFDEYNQLNARELYYRKQFLAAADTSPSLFPKLSNIDSPYIDIGGYGRYKTGETGLGQLEMLKVPEVTGSYTFADVHQFKLSVSRVDLSAGGSAGLCSSLPGDEDQKNKCFDHLDGDESPTNRLHDGVETGLSYRKDGWFSPFLRLGNTPFNGVISPTITFDVGFVQQTESGNWGLDIYSQPVRQSILSYTGVRNSNTEWGRVLRSGIKANGYHRFNKYWSMSASADVAMLNGENVKDNTAVAFAAGFGRNIEINGFDYFNVGPSFMFEHYDKNLSHFLPGHGGYFSPDQYYNLGFGVQFLTDEGKPFVIKGHAIAGFQSSKQESAPYFPIIDPGLGSYAGTSSFGDALDLEAKGVWLLTPNIQLGGGFGIRHTSNYEDYTGGFFIRYFFEDRKASYSTDIPNSLFNNMQMY